MKEGIRNVKSLILLILVSLWIFSSSILAQSPEDAREIVCETDVVVQADDWLSKIAEKFFGDLLAFPVIVQATNVKSATDETYAKIEDPNIIEAGWKLCIPGNQTAGAILNDTVATTEEKVETEIGFEIPTPRPIEYNGLQFVWEWAGAIDQMEAIDWYFDIKIFQSPNATDPYETLVVEPEAPQYLNEKWYSDQAPNFRGCSYWAIQIAKRDEAGKFERHISPESERLKVGTCTDDSTFSSPVNSQTK